MNFTLENHECERCLTPITFNISTSGKLSNDPQEDTFEWDITSASWFTDDKEYEKLLSMYCPNCGTMLYTSKLYNEVLDWVIEHD